MGNARRGPILAMSTPSIVMRPSLSSTRRKSVITNVDLP